MRAAVITALEGPGAIEIWEVPPPPEPGPGEVRLRVVAVGLNNSDLQATRPGAYPAGTPPLRFGQEAAGVIDAVGPGVEWRIGDRVAGHVPEALAEAALAAAGELVKVPEQISLYDAAALPVGYLTAGIALHFLAKVRKRDWVLVQAAAGGCGTAAVQLAKLRGARVIATSASAEKRARLRDLGADHVLDYGAVRTSIAELTGGSGVDVALDGAGEATFEPMLDVLAENGRLCLYGTVTGLPRGGTERILMRNASVYGISLWTNRHYWQAYRLLDLEVFPALAEGRLRSVVGTVRPLERITETMGMIERRQVFGKLVISTGVMAE